MVDGERGVSEASAVESGGPPFVGFGAQPFVLGEMVVYYGSDQGDCVECVINISLRVRTDCGGEMTPRPSVPL